MKNLVVVALVAGMMVLASCGNAQKKAEQAKLDSVLVADSLAQIEKAKIDSSDCSNWIDTVIDKVTGDTLISSKKTLIVSTDGGKTGFGIWMMQSSVSDLILVIQAVGAGSCIDEGEKINILFTDGSRLELANDGDFNCEEEATVYFGGIFGKKKQLEELKTKKIQTMRVWTSDGYVQEDFTKDNQEEFYHVINCLTI
ncbi:MAG: hypothetical protein WBI52_07565 [Bacteroidales bacterium]